MLLRGTRAYSIDALGYLGANISSAEYTPSPWVDLTRNARGWYATGAFDPPSVAVDATDSPAAATQCVFATQLQNANFLTGTYKGSYSSVASISMGGAVNCSLANVVQGGGLTTFDLVVTGSPQAILSLGGAAPDFYLLRPGYTIGDKDKLHDEALNHYKQFACLRFMAPLGTNSTTETTWASRVASTKRAGVVKSWESCISFANQVYAASGSKLRAIWITIPHSADATYISTLAALLRDTLNSGIVVYVEYSNEIWNFVFPQATWVYDAAGVEVAGYGGIGNLNYDGTADTFLWWIRLWHRNFKEMAQSFLSVFGQSEPTGRCRPVMMGQFVNSYWTTQGLAFLANRYPAALPATYCYALGAAPYMNGTNAEKNACADAAAMLTLLRTTGSNSLSYLNGLYQGWHTLSQAYSLPGPPMAYECGPHTDGTGNLAVKQAAHLDAGMGTLCADFLTGAWERRWGQMCWFHASPGAMIATNENSLWNSCQDFNNADYKQAALIASLSQALPNPVF